ncbi:Na+/H+ antiporter NhaA [Microbacterium pygmaeum]|uniref:Na(+)/H(+) antiporter NhaA n=1 Tax=Microbacterium pygmaeum TaxID=370764 RepID=A0A1G7X2Q1_9MICO|nr:Na+/H+ antiporter NhaA [Microbacterium pygmaeum]SDG78459.1 sodium/proton antiporter, NhaA family [Microbacterium pygmaeum]
MDTHAPPSRWSRLLAWVSGDVVGGAVMIGAAALALIWANSPWQGGYEALSDLVVGPAVLHLDLPLSAWAADGLLAIFFFVVGVELKQEIVAGSLRNPREAGVPVLAAVGGMAVPALLYVVIIGVLGPESALHGWAIPTATDIAFALAVLAIFGRGLPVALRVFLLTLAVVDDLLAIVIIAVFYSEGVNVWMLLGSFAAVALFAVAVRARKMRWWFLIPLALIAWTLMHSSGVHATIAGVLLGFSVSARPIRGEPTSRTTQLEHTVRPLSSGFALPVFAFFAAGVSLSGENGILAALGDPVAIAVIVALVVGKLTGVLGVTAVVTKTTPLRLPDGIGIRDLLPVGLLTGIGFTVSLLIAELSFPTGDHQANAKFAILVASVLAAVLAAMTLRWDARKARIADMNSDGIDDINLARIGDPPPRDPDQSAHA